MKHRRTRDLLEQQLYEWDESSSTWVHPYSGAKYAAAKESGAWSKSDYEKATEKGGAASVIAMNVVGGYENSEKALSGNAHCVIEDSWFDSDGSGIAIVYGPSMIEHLVIVHPLEESTVEIDIYSKEAVGSGMLDKVYGHQVGGSFQEVWKAFTGQDSYGH